MDGRRRRIRRRDVLMSKKFGGKYSPTDAGSGENSGPENAFRGRRVAPSYLRANLQILAPLPL